jgi:superfamily I DNA/RNA helicase
MIEELSKEKKLDYDQFAILYRTHAQSRNLKTYAMSKGSLCFVGGIKFWNRKEIKDILAYCRVMVNPYDDVSLHRIIMFQNGATVTPVFDHIRALLKRWASLLCSVRRSRFNTNLQGRVVKSSRIL